jgi:hypothetical protein
MMTKPASLVLALLCGLTFAACQKKDSKSPDGGVMCTTEAKMCPDGSGVGRTGPNCEFAPCPGEQPVACTEEAKVCPDGSSVGRQGPDCEFAPCPGEGEVVACTMDAKECPDGSAVGRVAPNCEFAPCPGE